MAPSHPRLRLLHRAGLLAVLGAIVGMAGDYCLLYSPQGGYLDGDFDFLSQISHSRMLWGHYLGLLAIPLEAAGLVLVWHGLRPLGERVAWIACCAGLYLMFCGVAYHGTVYPFAAQVGGTADPALLRPFSEPLGLAFAAVFMILVAVLTVTILRGKTAWPRSMALASPLLSYAAVMGLYLALPPVGNLLAPMGFNLSMAVFYGALALSARRWLPEGT